MMTLREILTDIHALEEDLLRFEAKYGVRSETFYAAYASGEEPEEDSWTLDFAEWASVYRTWLARHAEYRNELARAQPTPPKLARPAGSSTMDLHELVLELKLLERRLTLYEEKYGVLSEDFYRAMIAGELARYDEFDESRVEFSRWKGIYETWLRRKKAYDARVHEGRIVNALRFQPAC